MDSKLTNETDHAITSNAHRFDGYAYYDKNFDRHEAYTWLDNLLANFVELKYVDDERFAEMKIRSYLAAGKSPRYILGKLKEKGIDEHLVDNLLSEQEFDPLESALKLARKKKIGPYCQSIDIRKERRSKDLAILVRAGFDYDIAIKVLDMEGE